MSKASWLTMLAVLVGAVMLAALPASSPGGIEGLDLGQGDDPPQQDTTYINVNEVSNPCVWARAPVNDPGFRRPEIENTVAGEDIDVLVSDELEITTQEVQTLAGILDVDESNYFDSQEKDLGSDELPPGEYELEWDGRDNRGERVAAGVYFYSISAPGDVVQKKMVVLR